ncbi:MAG: hypothetical protein L6E13_13020, partial [Firmicutes bacterium]|nr:hypothetical protein [Bacillota bacterium]
YDDRYVYFTIRNHSERYNNRRDNPGKLVAVDKSSWSIVSEVVLPGSQRAAANTDPLVWVKQGLVIVGDTGGRYHAYGLQNGQLVPRPFVVVPHGTGENAVCRSVSTFSLLEPGEQPYTAPHDYQQLNGAGIDPVLATGGTDQGWLLIGVNAVRDGQRIGRLVALRAGGTYNVRWVSDSSPITVRGGEPITLTGKLQLLGTERSMAIPVWWIVQRQRDGQVVDTITGPDVVLPPGQVVDVPPITYTPDPAQGDLIVTGVANPIDATIAIYAAEVLGALVGVRWLEEWRCPGAVVETENTEAGLRVAVMDNFLQFPVTVQQPDLSVSDLRFQPNPAVAEEPVAASVAVTSDGRGWDQPVDAVLRWSVDGKVQGEVQVPALRPGETRRVDLGSFTAPNRPRVRLRAEVLPAPEETHLANNAVEVEVPVQLPDLVLRLAAPDEVMDTARRVPVLVVVTNTGRRAVSAEVAVSLNGQVVWTGTMAVPAGGRVSKTLEFLPGPGGTTMTFTGVVDPGNAIAEANEENNRHTVQTRVLRDEQLPPPPVPDKLEAWLIGG